MIIVGISGGIGNQLQQYALYKKYASLGVEARVDISWYEEDTQKCVASRRKFELNRFQGLDYCVCSEEEKNKLIRQDILGGMLHRLGWDLNYYTERKIYDPMLLRFTDKYVDGAFTCDYYYSDILPALRQNIRFPVDDCSNREKLFYIAHDIEKQYSISIHIRRGDYLNNDNMHIYGNICTNVYYSTALDIGLKNINEAKLYVFSDDPEYASSFASKLMNDHNKLSSFEVIDFNTGSDSLFDIYLMSLCDCNITANSTFSYWGARLNKKRNSLRIRPEKHKNSQECIPGDMAKLWKDWILVSSDGKVYQNS